MSYYPHNLPVGSRGGETEADRTTTMQSQTGTLVPTATVAERSRTASPAIDTETYSQGHVPLPDASHPTNVV